MASTTVREKLMGLKTGDRVRLADGKVYTLLGLRREEGKALCRTDVGLLEVGLPESREVPGIGLAKGRTITLSNVQVRTWYARRSTVFEVVG